MDLKYGQTAAVIGTDTFEALVLRVWKGKLFGASDDVMIEQLHCEGVGFDVIKAALAKAQRSQVLAQCRIADERGDT